MHTTKTEPLLSCPVCVNPLRKLTVGKTVIDWCASHACGVWLDSHELHKLDEEHEPAVPELFMLVPEIKSPASRLKCPTCPETLLKPTYYTSAKEVEIDHCAGCGGYWLDAGELGGVRYENHERKRQEEQRRSRITALQERALWLHLPHIKRSDGRKS